MKNLNKKILTTCLSLMMAVVMAVPAFAAPTYTVCPNLPNGSSNNYINLYGNSSSLAGRYITLYNPYSYGETLGNDQYVNKMSTTIDGRPGFYLTFWGNPQYAINRHSTSARAFMYPYPAGAYDSVFSDFNPEGSIRLLAGNHEDQYLGWESDSNLANVSFNRGGSNWEWQYLPGKDVK